MFRLRKPEYTDITATTSKKRYSSKAVATPKTNRLHEKHCVHCESGATIYTTSPGLGNCICQITQDQNENTERHEEPHVIHTAKSSAQKDIL